MMSKLRWVMLGLCVAMRAHAADPAPAATPAPAPAQAVPAAPSITPPAEQAKSAGPGEPAVQRTIIDDEYNHVEELRVRGQVQRITVSPKYGPRKPYEILPGDGGRDLSEGSNGSRGAAGQRVWNVLKF